MKNVRFRPAWIPAALALLMLGACARGDRDASPPEEVDMNPLTVSLTSAAFDDGGTIPTEHTCHGVNLSPPLHWSDPPPGTRSWALICDDPDAPSKTWVHWVIWNLPADARELPEGVTDDEELPSGARQGRTDFGTPGYGGPCPPPGKPHRYFFKLYALDAVLELKPGITKSRLQDEMSGHILAEGQLMGTFGVK
jgi:Raf kinase inhibitor-like YbhB/YbcL family protein